MRRRRRRRSSGRPTAGGNRGCRRRRTCSHALRSLAEAIVAPVPIRAVIFDVDFTIARPGPDLGPDGYRRLGERHGLTLDPSRYDDSRRAALADLKRHPELGHDEEIWV